MSVSTGLRKIAGRVAKNYVLDANVLLDFVEGGPAASRVEELLLEARPHGNPISMSVVNWGEVFYHSWQEHGEEAARRAMSNLFRLPIERVPVTIEHSLRAGEMKAVHKIPYVDSIAAALAVINDATLVTSDRDFEKLGRRFPILWLPHK